MTLPQTFSKSLPPGMHVLNSRILPSNVMAMGMTGTMKKSIKHQEFSINPILV
jgi:hypothetical protein